MLSVVNGVGLPLQCPELNTPHEWEGTESIERIIEAQAFLRSYYEAPLPLSPVNMLYRGNTGRLIKLLTGDGGVGVEPNHTPARKLDPL